MKEQAALDRLELDMTQCKRESEEQLSLPFASESTAPAVQLEPNDSGRAAVNPILPFYSPSENPYIADFCFYDTAPYSVVIPYSENIIAGKNTYIYDAHTYHTKVPPQGIIPLIDYYTKPGDIILDPFCGSGMTGVAALDRNRKVILCDISPAATFIAYNMCSPVNSRRYLEAIEAILDVLKEKESELYTTQCRLCGRSACVLYTVWSYGMLCSFCQSEFRLWDVARFEGATVRESKIKNEFLCPYCEHLLNKRKLRRTQRYPVAIGYKCCQKGLQERCDPPNDKDLALLNAIKKESIPSHLMYPTDPFPDGVNTRQPVAAGIATVDACYTPRALFAMAALWDIALRWPDETLRPKILFALTSLYQRVTVFSEFRFWGGSGNIANYNVPAIMNEQNVFKAFERKARTIAWYFAQASAKPENCRISTQSACDLSSIPGDSVDYIFTDPPFGANINYSEMNFLWESWLGVYTNTIEEAIVNKVQAKGYCEYEALLTRAFSEMRRVLKKNRWLSLIFHNSSAQAWQTLQKALRQAGFTIRGTQTFDKKHGTFKQFVSPNAVGYDLVLHCIKSEKPDVHSALNDGLLKGIGDFVRMSISENPSRYRMHYLHVSREDEFDYRRLYADWLAYILPNRLVDISFEDFRAAASSRIHADKSLWEGSLL
ncbi:MAG: hypothetical protein IT210_09470 [Armatimonadetes bacterium]|nr:hypothetical protein [Armatimonadota bacterium]